MQLIPVRGFVGLDLRAGSDEATGQLDSSASRFLTNVRVRPWRS